MGKRGCFVIKAQVRPDLWSSFVAWYETEHLPEAFARLGADRASRLHDREEPFTHVAIYEFDDIDWIQSEPFELALQSLINGFNQRWPDGVQRKRMFFDHEQQLP